MAVLANSILYFEYLDVSNGVSGVPVQVNILNATGVPSSYQLVYGSWSPNVSKRKSNLLSGNVSYQPVIEEITLNIIGATAAICRHNLQLLANMLDQADRWYDGQIITPVRVWYQPKGSTAAAVYNTLVLGNRSIDDWLQLPVTFDETGQIYRVNGVVVRFLRAGLWLQNDAANTANTGALANGNIGSLTLPTVNNIPSPCDCLFGTFATASIPQPVPTSVLIVAGRNKPTNVARLVKVDAEGMTTAGKYTSVNDAARNAVNGSILRYTPTDTLYNESNYNSVTIAGNVFAIYATVRNNSTTTTFKIKVTCAAATSATSASVARSTTPETYIDASIQTPRVVFLGTLARTGPTMNLNVTIQSSAAASSLDIDSIVIVAIDDELTSVLEIPQMHFTNELAAGTYNLGFFANQGSYSYEAKFLGLIPTRAVALMGITGVNTFLAVNGLMPIVALDTHVDMIWLCVAAAAADRWVFVDNANNPLALTFTVGIVYDAFLVPE